MRYVVPECMERSFIEGIWEQSTEQDSWTPETGRFGEAPSLYCFEQRLDYPQR